MSLYILMRVLESTADRYELGIRLLTPGCLEREYDGLIGRAVLRGLDSTTGGGR